MEQQVVEFLETYVEYLGKLQAASMTISEKLRADEASEALTIIRDFSEGLSWVAEGNTSLKNHAVDVPFDIEALEAFLNEINDGLTIRDYVLVADLFEYELEPFIGQYVTDVKKFM